MDEWRFKLSERGDILSLGCGQTHSNGKNILDVKQYARQKDGSKPHQLQQRFLIFMSSRRVFCPIVCLSAVLRSHAISESAVFK